MERRPSPCYVHPLPPPRGAAFDRRRRQAPRTALATAAVNASRPRMPLLLLLLPLLLLLVFVVMVRTLRLLLLLGIGAVDLFQNGACLRGQPSLGVAAPAPGFGQIRQAFALALHRGRNKQRTQVMKLHEFAKSIDNC